MISLKTMAAAAAAMVIIGSGAALAKDAKKPATPVVHSPESIECSKQADAKGLARQGAQEVPRAMQEGTLEKNKTEKKS